MRYASIVIVAVAALAACGPASEPAAPKADTAIPSTPPASAPAAAVVPEAVLTQIASFSAPYNEGDYTAGKRLFNQCKACHVVVAGGANLVGPNLHGVFGRKAGGVENFTNYSDDMIAADWTWDEANMDRWIENPRAVLAKTNMIYVGMKSPDQRRDLITYLKVEAAAAN
jgi:cytochrome c